MEKIKVSRPVWLALHTAYTRVAAGDPKLAKRWLDQCRTSDASEAAGGTARLETDYDWLLAFFAWKHGVPIPREGD